MRLSDYVAEFFVNHGVKDCFTVVGGGAMYLNDSLGHKEGLNCTYFHHEQAAAIAAEAYARLENKIAICCVTTGPGGTNAITGVVGGWLDSIPMFIISGQVRYDTTARYTMKFTNGFPLRSVGDQEYDITKSVSPMCKYAVMLENPTDIRWILEKAWYLAVSGRPGPIWIDIPVNFQGMDIDETELQGYDPSKDDIRLPKRPDDNLICKVIEAIRTAERPVIYAGGGIRLSGAQKLFKEVVDILGIPVCTYWNSIDLIEDENPLYCGRGGNMGNRAGNFAIQNADLLLVLGSRISIRQVGYNWESWAREAKVIMVDIDQGEMEKHTIHVDLKIWADVRAFLEKMIEVLKDEKYPISKAENWRKQCLQWKKRYPVVSQEQLKSEEVNVYGFIHTLSEELKEEGLCAVSNGACCVAGHQAWVIKKGSRFIINNAIASMGYGLPASIGLCIAADKKETVCLEGDGSMMMNMQELQTILTNHLPIKIFLINNQGYHSIRLTQGNLFSEHSKVGIGPESGDLSFPSYEKIVKAFGYQYFKIDKTNNMISVIRQVLSIHGSCFCEVFTDTEQGWEPKNSAKRTDDGRLYSAPLEDLAPFLPREELKSNMYIPLVEN